MREVHGVAYAHKVTMSEAESETQNVLVTDDGTGIRLTLTACSYPARLTPEEARFIAQALTEAADRCKAP
jgi:hypothetical protein